MIKDITDRLLAGNFSLADLQVASTTLPNAFWVEHPALAKNCVKKAQRFAEAFLAHDICDAFLSNSTERPLRTFFIQQKALSLARTGALQRAQVVLLPLKDQADSETLGILGGTYKACGPDTYQQAYDCYNRAYELRRESYPGINSAALALLLGQEDKARELATEVVEICLKEIEGPDDPYYALASMAEAHLVRGELDRAKEVYLMASAKADGRIADLVSTRRQARLLLEKLGESRSALDECFTVPNVGVFTGHITDRLDRPHPRFPPQFIDTIYQRLKETLELHNVGIGYCSGAAGADLLFAQALLERHGELHLVLPFSEEIFKKESLEGVPGRDWVSLFDEVAAKAYSIRVVNIDSSDSPDSSYDFGNKVFSGLAQIRANLLSTSLVPIAVWDGQPGDGRGGTADLITFWRTLNKEPVIVDLRAITEYPPAPRRPVFTQHSKSVREVRALMFATVKNYDLLRERDFEVFVSHFLNKVAEALAVTPYQPIVRNTWGNLLFMVFKDTRDAGLFGVQLRDLVKGEDWKALGFPEDLQIRISLHAGPVNLYVDPIINQYTYSGVHVTLGSQIEPISEEGQIFASEPFAALSAITGVTEFRCDYLGKQTTKRAAAYPIYLLKERDEP